MEAQRLLIEAAQRGSVEAFEQLIISVERQMLAVAAGLASYPDEADDIYQEALIKAFKALPTFRLESQFSTWLYRIFVHTALAYRKKLGNRFSRHFQDEDEHGYWTEQYLNPDHEVENTQLNRAINRAIKSLSERERVSFVLCHQQELSIGEAAAVMACTEGSVKSYLFRARDKLRKLLQEYQR